MILIYFGMITQIKRYKIYNININKILNNINITYLS